MDPTMAVTLALAGDTMLGRAVAKAIALRGPEKLIADEVVAITRSADLFVLNLECCIAERGTRWLDPRKHTLIHFVTREQGLIARPGSRIRSLHDLARPGVRFINRQVDASVAAAVADGRADAGFGLRADATRFKLAFVPLAIERYFFACAKSSLRGGALKALVELLQSEQFADAVGRLPGYDSSRSGHLEVLDAALTWVERPRKGSHA